MSEETDPMAIQHRALNAAYDRAADEAHRLGEKLGKRPALPEAEGWDAVFAEKPVPAPERRRQYILIRDDPDELRRQLEAAAEGLPPDKPLPRDFLQSLVEGEKMIAKELAGVREEISGLEVG